MVAATVNAPSRQDIAAGLGISRQMVDRLVKQGMPTDSVAAARAWRSANLREHMTKGHRIVDAASQAATAVARVHSLCPVAVAALLAGRFELVEGALRSALHAVPLPAREDVVMDVELWEHLTRKVRDHINALAATPAPPPEAEASSSDYDDLDLGCFWYEVAAGERAWVDA